MVQREINVQRVAEDIRKLLSSNPGLVKKVGIFGSLAHGDISDKSDIDLLIEYDIPSTFAMKSFANYAMR